MLYITHVRLSGGNQHEHITDVKWRNSQDGNVGQSTRAQMVEWLQAGNHAYVTDGTRTVEVGVVKTTPPYIRTYADGQWTDNLLALPRF